MFQYKIIGYAAIIEELKNNPGKPEHEYAEAANQSRLEAQRDQDVIAELRAAAARTHDERSSQR